MDSTNSIDQSRVQHWILNKYDAKRIEDELLQNNHTVEIIQHYLKAFDKARIEIRQTNGFIWMICGAFLGFVCCVLSLWNPIPELFYPILFGPTPLSIVIVCYGLYLVFE